MSRTLQSAVFVLICLLAADPSLAQTGGGKHPLEVSGGVGLLLYQSVYSLDQKFVSEAALRGDLLDHWKWQVGARLATGPVAPEMFVRILATNEIGDWRPMLGLEFGVTGAARFGAGDGLLREARKSMEGGISPVYFAVYAAPLSFTVWDAWHVSPLELQIGTHLDHTGRTMRLQLGLVNLGVTL